MLDTTKEPLYNQANFRADLRIALEFDERVNANFPLIAGEPYAIIISTPISGMTADWTLIEPPGIPGDPNAKIVSSGKGLRGTFTPEVTTSKSESYLLKVDLYEEFKPNIRESIVVRFNVVKVDNNSTLNILIIILIMTFVFLILFGLSGLIVYRASSHFSN